MESAKDISQQIQESKRYHVDNWDSLARDPQMWLRSATNLKEAADALRESLWPKVRGPYDIKAATADFRYGPVYMLLAGLAIETLIKGIIVGRKPELVEQQRLSKKLTTRHNLKDLYRTLGLPESKQHNNLLLRLQNYVENFGRYPVTKTKQDMQKLTDTRFAGQTDPNRVDRLWDYLVKKI